MDTRMSVDPTGYGRGAVCDDTPRILQQWREQAQARARKARGS